MCLPSGVVVVQDAFTSYFETALVLDVLALLRRLGFEPLLAPFLPNGKPLHVHGFLGAFAATTRRNAAMLSAITDRGLPLVGIDPSMTLSYWDEYAEALGTEQTPPVQLLQGWLGSRLEQLPSVAGEGRRFGGASLLHPAQALLGVLGER